MKTYSKFTLLRTKLTRYEFWPFWLFYIPAYFYAIFLVLKSRAWCYFTPANFCMKYAGAFGMEKDKILCQLPAEYVPMSLCLRKGIQSSDVKALIQKTAIKFPLIAKPNIGERGINVEKIADPKELFIYLEHQKYDTLIQEFIDYPVEAGVLYYRFPDGTKEEITSFTLKEFLSITGDGKSTFHELLEQNLRANFRIKYLQRKFHRQLNKVVPKGKTILLEPIGSHNRGTKFINANHLITPRLLEVFSKIAGYIDGYYYGRFDLKAKSLKDLYAGKNIKIMELNGVNSEPTHIYDPEYKIFRAYSDIFKHMKIIYHISMQNRERGYKPSPLIPFLKDVWMHLKKNK